MFGNVRTMLTRTTGSVKQTRLFLSGIKNFFSSKGFRDFVKDFAEMDGYEG